MCEMEGDIAVYGYARVSPDGQSLVAQLAELKAAKCEKIFQEKISGCSVRPQAANAQDGGPRKR
jgi:DNA invertase Pin-like site-specific DNA recombinase